MLLAKDFAHLKEKDWAKIAAKLLKPKKGEHILLSVSDEHAGGVTSCMPQAKAAIDGFAAHADVMLMNGDDFEYESPQAFEAAMAAVQQRFGDIRHGADYQAALQAEAERVLHEKVTEDIGTLREMLQAHPERKIVKVIGNHENFATFRNALSALEKECPNFQWTPELAIISMPGGSKEKRDRLLAAHGDLQMDDLWFVEDGGTDKERKCLTHEEMAKKVVGIATKSWAPSAQKQEKGQSIVNWWRKPNATAKTLYAELLFRAQEGDFHHAVKRHDLSMDRFEITERSLKKRKKKFHEFAKALDERHDLEAGQKEAESRIYARAIEEIEGKLKTLQERREELTHVSRALFPHSFKTPRTVLHYIKPGEENPRLLTSKVLEKVTHINYGHTHVGTEGVNVTGLNGGKVVISNNASVTGAIMKRPLSANGTSYTPTSGEEPEVELGNLSALVYRVKEGRITEITSIGTLLAQNIHQVRAMIREVQPEAIRETAASEGPAAGAIIQRRRAGNGEGRAH